MDTPGLPGAFPDGYPGPPPPYSRSDRAKPNNEPFRWKFEMAFQSQAESRFIAPVIGFFLSILGLLISLFGVLSGIFYHRTSHSDEIVASIVESRRHSQERTDLARSVVVPTEPSNDTSVQKLPSSAIVKPAHQRKVTFKFDYLVEKDDDVSSAESHSIPLLQTTSPSKSSIFSPSPSRPESSKISQRQGPSDVAGGLEQSVAALPSFKRGESRRLSVASIFSTTTSAPRIADAEDNKSFRDIPSRPETSNPLRKSMKSVRDVMRRKPRPADIIVPSSETNTDDETHHSMVSSSPTDSVAIVDTDISTETTPASSTFEINPHSVPVYKSPSHVQSQTPRRLSNLLCSPKASASKKPLLRTTYTYTLSPTTFSDAEGEGPASTPSSPVERLSRLTRTRTSANPGSGIRAASDPVPVFKSLPPRSLSPSPACSSARAQAYEALEGSSSGPRHGLLRRFSEANRIAASERAGRSRGRDNRSSLPVLPQSTEFNTSATDSEAHSPLKSSRSQARRKRFSFQ